MGSAPIGVQWPLTSSLGEFPGYWDWLWCLGLLPVLVSIAFRFAFFHISMFFHSLFFTCHWISFVFHLYMHLSVDPSLGHFFSEFPGLGLALVPDVVVPEAGQGCTWSRTLVSNFCPCRDLNLWSCSLMLRTLPLNYGAPPDFIHRNTNVYKQIWSLSHFICSCKIYPSR